MILLDAMGCENVLAINTGNFSADNTENFERYLIAMTRCGVS